MVSQADIRKRKLSEEQNSSKPRSGTSASAQDDDSDDDDDDRGVYEALWDAVSPPVPQRTVSIQGKDVRKVQQQLYHIEDFKLLKVLGKGSFGKVKILISFGSEFVKCMRLFSIFLGWVLNRPSAYPDTFCD